MTELTTEEKKMNLFLRAIQERNKQKQQSEEKSTE